MSETKIMGEFLCETVKLNNLFFHKECEWPCRTEGNLFIGTCQKKLKPPPFSILQSSASFWLEVKYNSLLKIEAVV